MWGGFSGDSVEVTCILIERFTIMQNTTTWSKAKEIMNAMVVAESDGEFAGLATLLEDLHPFVPDSASADTPDVFWSFPSYMERLHLTRALYRNYVAGTLSNHGLVYEASCSSYDLYVCKFNMILPDGSSPEVRVIFFNARSNNECHINTVIMHQAGCSPVPLSFHGEGYFDEIFSGLLDLLASIYVN